MTIRCIDAVVEIASVDILREGGITNSQEILGKYLGESTWICIYKCAQPVAAHHLGLINPHGIDRKKLNPHRALSDVIVTSAIFVELLKLAKWSEVVQWSSEPASSLCSASGNTVAAASMQRRRIILNGLLMGRTISGRRCKILGPLSAGEAARPRLTAAPRRMLTTRSTTNRPTAPKVSRGHAMDRCYTSKAGSGFLLFPR